eukprot:gnl/Spiro4/16720_TR8998_c0_g1_i2.p1 gnl/Spiro4/16720_TR8998_c0_g1~~gnl/Spiro4/16720_TR8998_c0_g1_i2.p1  ORF type:complete len:375 (-),score=85.40 gnl/Spiro4/16720_TR8998_c0_g1_i2:58-1182(-)
MFQSALGAASRVKVSQSWNSKPPIRVFEALGTDPYLNVATEDWLLGNPGAHHGTHTLFLWRNDPTIVIGRHQNMYKEVNVALCEKEKVCLVRRHSGGGAVYQDLGNTNFSIFSPKQTFDKTFNFAFITKALASLGIQAASQGRNDLVLPDNRKISGSAFKHSAAYSLHHGTLMVDVDVNALTRLLNPNKLKLESKGVASVASRVANMRSLVPSLTHGALVTALARAFSSAHGYAEDPDVVHLEPDSLMYVPEVVGSMRDLQLESWIFGFGKDVSEFSHNIEHRFPWGCLDVHLRCANGKLEAVKLFSDSLFPPLISTVEASLVGASFDEHGISDAVARAHSQLKVQAESGSGAPPPEVLEASLADIKDLLLRSR